MGIHVANRVHPADDIDIINTELILADLESCEKQLQRVVRVAKGGDKDAIAQKALLEKLIPHFEEGKTARMLDMSDDEKIDINTRILRSRAPHQSRTREEP